MADIPITGNYEIAPEIIAADTMAAENETHSRSVAAALAVGSLATVAAAAWGFEIGPWNEIVRTNIGINILESTADPNTVAAAITGVTFGIELGVSALAAAGFHYGGDTVVNTMRKLNIGAKKLDEIKADHEESGDKYGAKDVTADTLAAMGLGSAIVVAKHSFKDRFLDRTPNLAKSVAIGAAASVPPALTAGAIAKIMAEAIQRGGEADLGPVSQFIVDYGTNNVFWTSLLVGLYGGGYALKKFRDHGSNKEDGSGVESIAGSNIQLMV